MSISARAIALSCAALCLLAYETRAAMVVEPATGISITVTRDGTYTILFAAPSLTYSGAVSGGATNIRATAGTDGAGNFQAIEFDERAKPARHFEIRTWSARPGVLFTQTVPTAVANPPAFPRFTTSPALPYKMSFRGCWFTPHFDLTGHEGPWLFFDADANAAILSAAANFMVATLSVGANGEIASGIDPAIATLPQGNSHSTLLVAARGINRAFDTWGRILTDFQGKIRPPNDADVSLKYLGYWTDNGAAYYYAFDPAKGYEGTLLDVRDDFARMGLPLGYMQLDSWWYRKGESGDWNPKPDQWDFGIHTYVAHPDLFPNGLASFQSRLGLPLVTHARWIDVKSPLRAQYKISNNVAVDPQYWNNVAAYLKQSGVSTYEQDWLDSKATANFDLADPEAFMDNMASAFAANGITMQYCMPTPRHVLQGSKYSNLTSIRMSDDHFERKFWPQVLYASRLASAVGIWPWYDVFSSDETGNLVMATLSGGIVGASDAIGTANVRNLQRVARADGVIVKPDAVLVPTDATFIDEAQNGPGPMVGYTYSDNGSSRAVYIHALKRGDDTTALLTPRETGLTGRVLAYDTRHRSATIVDADATMSIDLSQDWANLVLVPIARSGIAIVGDTGKFVPRGRQRIASLVDRSDGVDVEVAFAAGESSVTLTGYSPLQPLASRGDAKWDSASGLFELVVTPAAPRVTIAIPRHRASR